MDKQNNSRTVITQTPINMEQGNPAGMAHVADYLIIIAYLLQLSGENPMTQEEEGPEEEEGEEAEGEEAEGEEAGGEGAEAREWILELYVF